MRELTRCIMLLVLIVAFAAACVAADEQPAVVGKGVIAANPSGGQGGKTSTFPNEQVTINGKARVYRLVVPKAISPDKPAPLLFAFHGLLDSKDLMPIYSQLDALADEQGCILVYPNAVDKAWPLVLDWAKDDLAFFDSVYASITGKYNIDLNRVYLTGMSNGAYFIHLLASQRSEKIAALAAHSGGLGLVALAEPKVAQKYAVMLINGDSDALVKVEEGRKARDAYQKWGFPVEYLEIPGQNHLWALNVDINHKIWKFFLAHPLRQPVPPAAH